MDKFRIAVKAFIVEKELLLLIKRRSSDPHTPGAWDVPGGRLEFAEDPIEGLKRETKEETGLEIEVKIPIDVKHFIRDDGQRITMITFLCTLVNGEVRLSEEHSESRWLTLQEAAKIIHPAFVKDVQRIIGIHVRPE